MKTLGEPYESASVNPSFDRPEAYTKEAIVHPERYGIRQISGWVLGPAALLLTVLLPPPAVLSSAGWQTAGGALLMATRWITEALPLPATALLPLVLFSLLKLGTVQESAASYASPIIYLFLGGLVIAVAMQRWNLYRRVAITIIAVMGTRPSRVIAGFLVAAASLSMWVSNTAIALMILPIAQVKHPVLRALA